jgi:hypothetical protein
MLIPPGGEKRRIDWFARLRWSRFIPQRRDSFSVARTGPTSTKAMRIMQVDSLVGLIEIAREIGVQQNRSRPCKSAFEFPPVENWFLGKKYRNY